MINHVAVEQRLYSLPLGESFAPVDVDSPDTRPVSAGFQTAYWELLDRWYFGAVDLFWDERS
jgi:hypothetical protein